MKIANLAFAIALVLPFAVHANETVAPAQGEAAVSAKTETKADAGAPVAKAKPAKKGHGKKH